MEDLIRIERAEQRFLDMVGDGYLMGTSGQLCTTALRRDKVKRYPTYAANIQKYCPVLSGKQATCEGCKLNGKKVHDCRGATYEVADDLDIPMTSIGSNSQWKDDDCWAVKGDIVNVPKGMLCILFRESQEKPGVMKHTGALLRDGTVVDARGHAYGVLHQLMEKFPWTHYAIWIGLYDAIELPEGDYVIEPVDTQKRKTLRLGSQGALVATMQGMLIQLGYDLGTWGADGDFGDQTLKALKAFQEDQQLTVDGKCGPITWTTLDYAITQLPGDEPDEEDPEDDPVSAPDETQDEASADTANSAQEAKEHATLRLRSRGDEVREIQTLLNEYFASIKAAQIKVDGIFGPITLGAVLAFQKAAGITQDGVCGPVTWGKLDEVTAKLKTNSID